MGALFRDNVVVLTGASRGIGHAVALGLAEQGAQLVLAARTAADLQDVVTQCLARGAQVVGVPTDVSERAQCEQLIQQAVTTYGRVDTLINNAGITMWSRFEDLQELDILERLIKVNYLGSAYCTYYALPHLKRSRGRLVAVSSLTGKTGVPTRSGYAASKHAMVGFFDSLRIEVAPYGITVTMIYPGFVATETRSRATGPDGRPLGRSPVQEANVMSAETCARIIIAAAGKRKREEVMTLRGKLGQWLKLLAPQLVDRIARQAIERGR